MDNYILIHLLEDEEPAILGVTYIASIQPLHGADSEGTEINLSQGSVFITKESFNELMKNIDSLYKTKCQCGDNCDCRD